MLDNAILAVATLLATAGVGGLIGDEVRAARAERGSWFSESLGWTLLWVAGLIALFVAAWVSPS